MARKTGRKRATSKGKCYLCNAAVSKTAMTSHLQSCLSDRESVSENSAGTRGLEKTLHIIVEGRYQPWYWMHLDVRAKAKLKDLDRFLRDIWLECCGHLSAFIIQKERYSSSPDRFGFENSMNFAVGGLLLPGIKCYYEYDFGTPTELVLTVVSERLSERKGGKKGAPAVQLLARNNAPAITCLSCGGIATQVCSWCVCEGGNAWLCDDCAAEHACGEDYLLLVVNSPRVGICGYTGPQGIFAVRE